jgi:C-terminal processing protease CtpA/Prc
MEKVIINLKTAQKCILALVTVLSIGFTTSCVNKDKPSDKEEEIQNYEKVNKWIFENMRYYYLWNTKIPSKTDYTLFPAEYFESLLYRPTDRFSWIQEDYEELLNSLSGVNTETGYDFNLLQMSKNSSDVIGYITYIKPNTPAESAGLRRGEYFHEINGTQMTLSNYSSLIEETSKPHTIGISIISEDTITGVKNVSLGVIENYPENPILLDTVYNISGKNVGYFVYNFFARDKGDGSIAYEIELNNLFGKFKSEQIDELIVDLRYNGGGAIITTQALASMISGQGKDKVFYIDEYNYQITSELIAGNYDNKSYFIDRINNSPINSLSGLPTVYFIVSRRSASASELLINGLKPYMDVVLIGTTTYGKNVASISIYDEDDPDNKWGLQPIIAKISNAEGFSDYGDGFVPDRDKTAYENEEDTIRQLGDTEELLLRMTLDEIFNREEDVVATTKHTGYRTTSSFIGSAIDRNPARRNQYITLKDIAARGNK